MPPLSWGISLSYVAVSHSSNLSASVASASNAVNPVDDGLKVICAWPVSGSYGAGSRVLFYVLVVTTVFARKLDWIKSAGLSTALPLSTAAAVHGIVLASLHRDTAVDMDIYGAFQMCSLGTLVVPLMIKLTKSHEFSTHTGRRIMFIWAGLVLAGLICLAIEFFRAQTFLCLEDGQGNPMSSNLKRFPYGTNITCRLTCSESDGPFSPIRIGSANNIYVIPAPSTLTFGAATLIAAGCCIHTIIWMAVMTERFNTRTDSCETNEPISGTHATKGSMNDVNHMVHLFLSVASIPVSGCAAVAIIIVGEINFFSGPVNYQSEALANIGQWSTLVGTGLGASGALYILLARDMEASEGVLDPNADNDLNSSLRNRDHGSQTTEDWIGKPPQITRAIHIPFRDVDSNTIPLPRPQRADTQSEEPSFRRRTHSLPPPVSKGREKVREDAREMSPPGHHNSLQLYHPKEGIPLVTMSGGRRSSPRSESNGNGDNGHELASSIAPPSSVAPVTGASAISYPDAS